MLFPANTFSAVKDGIEISGNYYVVKDLPAARVEPRMPVISRMEISVG